MEGHVRCMYCSICREFNIHTVMNGEYGMVLANPITDKLLFAAQASRRRQQPAVQVRLQCREKRNRKGYAGRVSTPISRTERNRKSYADRVSAPISRTERNRKSYADRVSTPSMLKGRSALGCQHLKAPHRRLQLAV
jgi:hypothetical protein